MVSESRLSFNISTKLWQVYATGYLLVLPCWYWFAQEQDEALAAIYPVATVMLLGFSSSVARDRSTVLIVGWVVCLAVLSTLGTFPAHGFPPLALYVGLAWMVWWSLRSAAPDGQWIERRIVWLALANVGLACSQALGYHPFFESEQPVGWFSKRTQLGMLLLVAFPLANRWQRGLLSLGAVLTGSLTAMGGIALWWLHRRLTRPVWWLCLAVALVTSVLIGWEMRWIPRLLVWEQVIGEAVWSPLYGHGLGIWEALHGEKYGLGPWMYSSYLAAFHIGGALLTCALGWAVWAILRLPSSPSRSALLLLAIVACVQTPWHFIRMVIVTMALVAASHLGRDDEGH